MLIAGKTEWLEEAIFGRSQQSTNGSVCNSCKLCTEALQHSAPLCCEEKRIRPVALPWTVDAWPTSLLTTFRRRRSIRSQGLQAAQVLSAQPTTATPVLEGEEAGPGYGALGGERRRAEVPGQGDRWKPLVRTCQWRRHGQQATPVRVTSVQQHWRPESMRTPEERRRQ